MLCAHKAFITKAKKQVGFNANYRMAGFHHFHPGYNFYSFTSNAVDLNPTSLVNLDSKHDFAQDFNTVEISQNYRL